MKKLSPIQQFGIVAFSVIALLVVIFVKQEISHKKKLNQVKQEAFR